MASYKSGKRRILVVMGTRPEVIKLAPVIMALKRRRGEIETVVCTTGQHRQILDQMLGVFDIKPDFDLNLMKPDQTLPGLLQSALRELNKVTDEVRPDMTVVQGDTLTATAAALSSYYARVPVAHVEAGLRSHDRNNPFPEEANRLIVDQISDLMFVPTKTSCRNLEREGFPRSRIFITGNTVIDALRQSLRRTGGAMSCCRSSRGRKLVLVTLHRRESFGRTFKGILRALRRTVEENRDIFIVYPVHPNPNVSIPAREMLKHPRIRLIDPLPYLQFLELMANSDLVVTDSGGVQEEAPALNKTVLVLREKTERSEAVAAGCARLIGTNHSDIVRELKLSMSGLCETKRKCANIYGDGKASERISSIILNHFYPEKHRLPAEFIRDITLKDIEERDA